MSDGDNADAGRTSSRTAHNLVLLHVPREFRQKRVEWDVFSRVGGVRFKPTWSRFSTYPESRL